MGSWLSLLRFFVDAALYFLQFLSIFNKSLLGVVVGLSNSGYGNGSFVVNNSYTMNIKNMF